MDNKVRGQDPPILTSALQKRLVGFKYVYHDPSDYRAAHERLELTFEGGHTVVITSWDAEGYSSGFMIRGES